MVKKKKVDSAKEEILENKNKLIANVERYSPAWWEILMAMLYGESKEDRRFAMAEYNKLQVKTLPTQVTGKDGEPIVVKWLD